MQRCRDDLRPPVLLQINLPFVTKLHTFLFQTRVLFVIAAGWPQADPALRVDDAMPGNIVVACAHRPADGARGRRWRAQRPRDLPVRGDAPARDFPNERVDALEKCGGCGLVRMNIAALQMNLRAAIM